MLSPASRGVINTMKTNGVAADTKLLATYSPSPSGTPTMVQTIRTVPSFDTDTSSESPSVATRNSTFSTSVNSNASAVSMASHQGERTPSVRLKYDAHQPDASAPRSWAHTNGNGGGNGSLNGNSTARPAPDLPLSDGPTQRHAAGHDTAADDHGQGWDSSVGKAGLGKTGRVINKLVSDNEALKRDIQIERLRAEESKQAAKLTEDKMERLISDYESRLLEASVTKTLLSRKERQVEALNAAIDLERKRTHEAQERERSWRDEMERMRSDTTAQVDEASARAAMMEGRYTAIASHWREQGDEVKRAAGKLRGDIAALSAERQRDDEKIQTLRELCDQQDGNIRELKREKGAIEEMFEAYKRQQDDMLAGIKRSAGEREKEQERLLEETRATLGKLKWALNVRENVKGAQ